MPVVEWDTDPWIHALRGEMPFMGSHSRHKNDFPLSLILLKKRMDIHAAGVTSLE